MHKGMPRTTLSRALLQPLTSSFLRHAIPLVLLTFLIVIPTLSSAEDPEGVRPLLSQDQLLSTLSEGTRLLDDAEVIERFLDALDGIPPNWQEIYGKHGDGHDERLFALNRKRDLLREGRGELTSRLMFLWSGELSRYDSELGGFHVAMGPKLIPTRWGLVRFKADNLPSNLVAVPPPKLAEQLRTRVWKGDRIEIDVAITGRLLPEESIIYDFAHEEPEQGMVMPVVRVEKIDYLLAETLVESLDPP
jgi:hypothetical protein